MEGEKINVKGRISRVTTKFAFVATDKGTVFCPLAASIPSTEHVPDMTTRYNIGDFVHITAVSQCDKNNCKWRATKMRMAMNELAESTSDCNYSIPAEVVKCIGIVTHVTETFAYCLYKGDQVFVPGAAFSSSEVTRLNAHFNAGDELELEIKLQQAHNDCKWIAIRATKHIRQLASVIKGFGRIAEVSSVSATVLTDEHGYLLCPILTWCGGDGGTSAKWLDEILQEGDEVTYHIASRDDGINVVSWSAKGFYPGKRRAPARNISTQTVPGNSEIVLKALRSVIPTLLADKPTIRMLYETMNEF